MGVLARFPVRAKSGEIELAQLPSYMFLRAQRSEFTEALVVVFARRQPTGSIRMKVETLMFIEAVTVANPLVAFGHLPQVVFV